MNLLFARGSRRSGWGSNCEYARNLVSHTRFVSQFDRDADIFASAQGLIYLCLDQGFAPDAFNISSEYEHIFVSLMQTGKRLVNTCAKILTGAEHLFP